MPGQRIQEACEAASRPALELTHTQLADEIVRLRAEAAHLKETEYSRRNNPHSPDCKFFLDVHEGMDYPRDCTCAVKLRARVKELEAQLNKFNDDFVAGRFYARPIEGPENAAEARRCRDDVYERGDTLVEKP